MPLVTVPFDQDVILTTGSRDSAFNNTLGYAVINEDGTFGEAVALGNDDDLRAGSAINLGRFAADTQLVFFIVQNGGNFAFTDTLSGSLRFVNRADATQPARIDDPEPPVLLQDTGARLIALNGNVPTTVLFALDELNPAGAEQARFGTDASGNTQIAFEDVSVIPTRNLESFVRDEDFNDAVFSLNIPVAGFTPEPVSDDVLISTPFTAELNGGTGDDTYFIVDGTSVEILDPSGRDTLDASLDTDGALIDLNTGATSVINGVAVTPVAPIERLPLDLVLLQDLSGSFLDDVDTLRDLAGDLVDEVRALQPDSLLGVASFVDKPIVPFGVPGEFAYNTDRPLTDDPGAFTATIDGLTVAFGNDTPESQLEALLQLGLRAEAELGYRAEALRVAVLATDAPFHIAGDFAGVPANDGDTILDGNPPATGEDYPSIAQVRDALVDAGIAPIFAVTSDQIPVYQDLVAQLGFGEVVTLNSDSSNIVDILRATLPEIEPDILENVIGGPGDDTIIGNALDNVIAGGLGADRVTGGAGADTVVIASVAEGIDTVTDFVLGEDALDLGALLAALGRDVTALSLTGEGDDVTVAVDTDGDAATAPVPVALLSGPVGVDAATEVAALLDPTTLAV